MYAGTRRVMSGMVRILVLKGEVKQRNEVKQSMAKIINPKKEEKKKGERKMRRSIIDIII